MRFPFLASSPSSSPPTDSLGWKLSKQDKANCTDILKTCEMFQKVPHDRLNTLVQQMTVRYYTKNETFAVQGEPCDRFYLLQDGDIRRQHYDEASGKQHEVAFAIKASSLNTMRVLSGDPYHNTVKCVSEEGCKLYEMRRDAFLNTLRTHPDISLKVAEGLSEALRFGSKKYQTPLLEQQQQEINVPAVAIAAGVESYYRSALNALLNARLTGVRAELFPNMHIQVPVRIAYITGFKGLRAILDSKVEPDQFSNPTLIRLGMALAPGVLMTPIASILEASNAGHLNSEPMYKRWMRGVVPRCGREIIFGLGLNQLSDYFEERLQPMFPKRNHVLANAAGSLMAGVVSGYFSHVPHNLSTYKLLEPHKSYSELYRMFVDKSVPPAVDRLVEPWPHLTKTAFRYTAATLFPRGLLIRTTQIVGSFMILNGIINYVHLLETRKIHKAMGAT